YGLVWPSLISLSLTPGSYFFCARTMLGAASANADADATSVRRLIFVMCFLLDRPVPSESCRECSALQRFGRREGQAQRLGDGPAGHLAPVAVQPVAQVRILGDRLAPALVGQCQREGQGGVVQREGRGAR